MSGQGRDVEQGSLIQNILKTTKREMEVGKLKMVREPKKMMNMMKESPTSPLQAQAAVSSNSSDYELAKTYAPQLRLSGPGAIGLGVNLFDQDYPYIDYLPILPINVNDITSNVDRKIKLHLSNSTKYLSYGGIDTIGYYRASTNYLNFFPIWENASLANGNYPVEDGYKTLILRPTIYFRVFKDYVQKIL